MQLNWNGRKTNTSSYFNTKNTCIILKEEHSAYCSCVFMQFPRIFCSQQMASMKMFQIQFHTGFVPRNATTVKFAKYVDTLLRRLKEVFFGTV